MSWDRGPNLPHQAVLVDIAQRRFYFFWIDTPTLAQGLFQFTAHPVAYIAIAVVTATIFFFGGFMREQVCNCMCPWPRIQTVMQANDPS